MILTGIKEAAERYPDKIAVQMKVGDRYQQYTYRDLVKSIASAAHALSGQGILTGDKVALLSENRPEWVIAYLSVVSLGAVIVPLDAQLTGKEVEILLSNSDAKAAFVSAGAVPKLPRTRSITVLSFDAGYGLSFRDMMTAHPGAALPLPPPADHLAALLYTSGTTGDPKGVMLSHGNLVSNAASVTRLEILKPGDNLLGILPLHHTYPSLACILLALRIGTTLTLLNSLKGPDITACMRETEVSVMLGVPQLFSGLRRAVFDEIRKKPLPARMIVKLLLKTNGLLRKSMGVNIGKAVFSAVHEKFGTSLRLLASGGARLEPDVYTDMTDLGFTIIEGYGLTETSPVCTFNPVDKQKPGSIGIPIPGVEVRIANPDDTGQGEIAVRGPNVMPGYYKKPLETGQVLRDGWFYTGDLGYRDKDGYFFINGRSKEVIVLATGKKIFPEELEKFYKRIPSIKELCLVQTERGIEAAVVPDFDYLRRMNLPNSRETIAFELEDIAKDLPPYKRISGLKIFKEPLPVTRLGKLKRGMVKDMYVKSGERAEKPVAETDRDLLSSPVGRKVTACLEPLSAKKNIVPDDNLELDLGLDSLARVELLVSLERSFGLSLPDSFASEIFTAKDAVLRIRDLLASGHQVKTGEQVRMTWAEILRQELSEEVRKTLKLDSGMLCTIGKFLLKSVLTLILRTYNRLSVRGLENLPANGPFIIAPNHLSFIDAPAIMSAIPWRQGVQTFFLGATVYFGRPITSRIAKIIQVIPVDMETRLYAALQLSAYVLKKRKILCVFPEGTRSRDGKIREFKKGVAILARELNIPLVPVAVRGSYQVLAPGRIFLRPAKVTVNFGKPVYPGGMDYDAIVKKLHDEVVKLL